MKIESVASGCPTPPDTGHRLRVLVLADDQHPANVVRDHISEIMAASRHSIYILNPIRSRQGFLISPDYFDALLIHYSVAVFSEHHFPETIVRRVSAFPGAKVQIVQDEYRKIDLVMQMMRRLGVTSVFSSLAEDNIARVYGRGDLDDVTFYSSIPGYISRKLLGLDRPPIEGRPYHLVYRGRTVPVWLGQFGREKVDIARQAEQMAKAHALKIDVSCNEADRIYGDQWWGFLQSGRAALALEGGSSVFDFDGSIQEACEEFAKQEPEADHQQIWRKFVKEHDGNIVHKTITPRVLEAIIAGTPLVMYPGNFRGVLEPWTHYIPLEPDGGNEDRVAQLLKDTNYLQDLADRAYEHVRSDKTLHFAHYVQAIETAISMDASKAPKSANSATTQNASQLRKLKVLNAIDRGLSAVSPGYALMRVLHFVARSPLNRTLATAKDTLVGRMVTRFFRSRYMGGG